MGLTKIKQDLIITHSSTVIKPTLPTLPDLLAGIDQVNSDGGIDQVNSDGGVSKFQMPSVMQTNEFKILIKLLITAIITDEKLPESIVKILRDEAGGEDKMIEVLGEFNDNLSREFPVDALRFGTFDIYKTKMSGIFDIMTTISPHEAFAPQMQIFNMVVTYISLHMLGEEEWVVEQFRQLLNSEYENSIPITLAVQLIQKLDGVIDMSSDLENDTDNAPSPDPVTCPDPPAPNLVPVDSQSLIDLGASLTRCESEKSVDTLAAQKLCEETEELLVETEGLLLEAKSKIKKTVEEKDKIIKYVAGGAIAVIIILIILLLLK